MGVGVRLVLKAAVTSRLRCHDSQWCLCVSANERREFGASHRVHTKVRTEQSLLGDGVCFGLPLFDLVPFLVIRLCDCMQACLFLMHMAYEAQHQLLTRKRINLIHECFLMLFIYISEHKLKQAHILIMIG